ncbi:MAG: hypothetical protein ACI8UO_000335 [Verrucomicrobiales bacterium]|jgi:hypothetical protein
MEDQKPETLPPRSQRWTTIRYWVGIAFCTGPIWGLVIAMIGVTSLMDSKLDHEGKNSIHFVLTWSAAGMILMFFGIAMVVSASAARKKLARESQSGS